MDLRKYTLDLKKFGEAIADKRGDRSLSDIAAITGLSPSTLSRIERGYLNDHKSHTDSFLILCSWLDIEPSEFVIRRDGKENDFGTQLRASSHLSSETAQALMEAVRIIYEQMQEENADSEDEESELEC